MWSNKNRVAVLGSVFELTDRIEIKDYSQELLVKSSSRLFHLFGN